MTASARERVREGALPLLVLIGDPLPPLDALRAAEQALRGGARFLQLRVKHARREDLLAVARALVRRCRAWGALCTVNDDVDLARAAAADGVHLGQGDAPPALARRRLGARAIVGWTVHTPAEARAAARLASTIDYVGAGPVYGSPTKPALAAQGLALIRAIARALGHERGLGDARGRRLALARGLGLGLGRAGALPIYAIGGVSARRALACFGAGARGVAIGSAITSARAPAAAARAALAALALARPARPRGARAAPLRARRGGRL